MFLSLFGITFVILLSFLISKNVDNLFGLCDTLKAFFKKMFDGLSVEKFENGEDVFNAVNNLKLNFIFTAVLKSILKNVTFSSGATLGQIFSPTLSVVTYRILLFGISFVFLLVFIKLIEVSLSFIIKKTGLSPVNRFLGLLFGIFKGMIASSVVFLVLSTIASAGLSENLTNFINHSYLSNYLYENYIISIFNSLYSFLS